MEIDLYPTDPRSVVRLLLNTLDQNPPEEWPDFVVVTLNPDESHDEVVRVVDNVYKMKGILDDLQFQLSAERIGH